MMFKTMTRYIKPSEINRLLHEKPDFAKYPEEQQVWPYKRFHDHHLFALIDGNPQSIILIAPLLADADK